MSVKLKLDFDEMANEFFRDTRIIGVVASMKDYQFCWQLNQILGFDFRINNEIEIQLNRKNRNYYFSVFEYSEPHNSLVHYLYNNEYDGEYLLPEFKHLEFLWLMKGDLVKEEFLQELSLAIKNISGVQLVMEINNSRIKNKAHLIF